MRLPPALFAAVLLAASCYSLTACGGEENEAPNPTSTGAQHTATTAQRPSDKQLEEELAAAAKESDDPEAEEARKGAEEAFSNLFVADLRSGRVARLTSNHGEDRVVLDPAWTPDGRSLVYAQVPCDDCEPYLQVLSAGGGKPRRLFKGSHPTLLRGGHRFVFVGPTGGLFIGDIRGGRPRRLASDARPWSEPSAARDGRRIVAVTQARDGSTRLAVLTLADRRPRLLPALGRSIVNPSWSPDGRRIAFASLRDDGRWRIYETSPTGHAARRISRGASDTEPTYSPAGSKIAFVRTYDGGRAALLVSDSDGAGASSLLTRTVSGNHPAWSPDGAHVAFVVRG